MTQVQLDRYPYAKHTFYKGVYTHNSVEYAFELTVEESENSIRPNIIVEFEMCSNLLTFSYDKAYKEIIAIYLPDGKIN
jgi:hypothetical protein